MPKVSSIARAPRNAAARCAVLVLALAFGAGAGVAGAQSAAPPTAGAPAEPSPRVSTPSRAPVVPVVAQTAGGAARTQLQQFVTGTRSARGEFTQRTLRGPGQQAETASGSFAFARPGKFRWEVRKPYEQLMVADGERLWFFDKDLNQVTERKLSDSLGASPAAILFGSDDLEKSFTVSDGGERDGLAWLDAVPRSKDAGFERILIGFGAGLPEAMEVRDAFGRTTRFAFRSIERNVAIDAGAFTFTAPRGADVIRQ